MQDDSKKDGGRQAAPYGPDTIEGWMRLRIRATIEAIVDEELEAVLGAEKSARVGRRGRAIDMGAASGR